MQPKVFFLTEPHSLSHMQQYLFTLKVQDNLKTYNFTQYNKHVFLISTDVFLLILSKKIYIYKEKLMYKKQEFGLGDLSYFKYYKKIYK